MANKNQFKKDLSYELKYKKGLFLVDEPSRKKLSDAILNPTTWIEIFASGANADNTEFIVIKLNNLPEGVLPTEKI